MTSPFEQLQEIKAQMKINSEQQQKKIEEEKRRAEAEKKEFEKTYLGPDDEIPEESKDSWEKFVSANKDIRPIKNSNFVTLENIPLASAAALEYRRKSAITETVQEIHEFSNQFVKYLDPSDLVGFKRDGIQYGVYAKVKHGEYQIRARLDLHKHTLEQARAHTQNFLNYCFDKGFRVVIIVHGKGEFTSPKAFLKSHVFSWMKQSELVLAAHSAMPYHGGAGALYVLLKKNDEMKSDNRQKYF